MICHPNVTLARFPSALPVFPALYRIIILRLAVRNTILVLCSPGFPLAVAAMLLPTRRKGCCRQGCRRPWGLRPLSASLCWGEDRVYLPRCPPFRSPFRLLPASLPPAGAFIPFPAEKTNASEGKTFGFGSCLCSPAAPAPTLPSPPNERPGGQLISSRDNNDPLIATLQPSCPPFPCIA